MFILRKSRGNLLLTFIILIALSITILSFLSFMIVRTKESGSRVADSEAFYYADAGLNKAIWYLATPTSQGGHGLSWTTTNLQESFGSGDYRISVISISSTQDLIISTGESKGVSRMITEAAQIGGLPSAFTYAVYCNSGVDFTGNSTMQGDIYVNGDTTFGNNCSDTNGYVYHPSGATISGQGTWTDGGTPSQPPTFPTFDTSYYDNLITAAGNVTKGDVDYKDTTVNLNGGTIYVNGDVNISKTTTFNGPGVIVASGAINVSGTTNTSNSVTFISNKELNMSGNTNTSGATYYSATDISASGNVRMSVGTMLTKGNVSLSGNLNIDGLVFSDSGVSKISGNPTITGSIVCASISKFSGNPNVYYDASKLTTSTPIGFTATSIAPVKGTWKSY